MCSNLLTQWRSIKNSAEYHGFFHDYISVNYTETVQPTCDLQCYEQKADFIIRELQGTNASMEECEVIMSQLYAYLTGWSDPCVKDSIKNRQLRLVSSIAGKN